MSARRAEKVRRRARRKEKKRAWNLKKEIKRFIGPDPPFLIQGELYRQVRDLVLGRLNSRRDKARHGGPTVHLRAAARR